MPGTPAGIQIVAAGAVPQLADPGQYARNTVGALAQKQIDDGDWQITCLDPTVIPDGSCVLILTPGSGSNIAEGISFGQANPQTVDGFTLFAFSTYRNDTGAKVAVPVQFVIVKWAPTVDVD